MKTTLELPDELLTEAKAMALRRRTTLKALFTRALERELHGMTEAETGRFVVDAAGWPVLRREPEERVTVTEQWIEELRESEQI